MNGKKVVSIAAVAVIPFGCVVNGQNPERPRDGPPEAFP